MRNQQVVPGVISEHETYTLEEFLARMNWGRHAMRQARRGGLEVRYIASRGYVSGREAVAFIAKAPTEHSGAPTSKVRK